MRIGIVGLGDAVLLRDVEHLTIVGSHQLVVDGTGTRLVLLLRPKVELHLSALQGLRYHVPHLHLLFPIEGSHAGVQVKLLTVQ